MLRSRRRLEKQRETRNLLGVTSHEVYYVTEPVQWPFASINSQRVRQAKLYRDVDINCDSHQSPFSTLYVLNEIRPSLSVIA